MLSFSPLELSVLPRATHVQRPTDVLIRNNLYFLAKHLLTVQPERFDMDLYFRVERGEPRMSIPTVEDLIHPPCSTSACACGYTFAAGVSRPEHWRPRDLNTRGVQIMWAGLARHVYHTPVEGRPWHFLFDTPWERHAPSNPRFAAWRICYYLNYGAPEGLSDLAIRDHYRARQSKATPASP